MKTLIVNNGEIVFKGVHIAALDYKYFALSPTGEGYLLEKEPVKGCSGWISSGGINCVAVSWPSYSWDETVYKLVRQEEPVLQQSEGGVWYVNTYSLCNTLETFCLFDKGIKWNEGHNSLGYRTAYGLGHVSLEDLGVHELRAYALLLEVA